MNNNIKRGCRVSAEKYDHSLKRLVKIKGFFEGFACNGEAIILLRPYNLDAPVDYVVPSSMRLLVKKKKPETFTTSKGFIFTKTPLGWIDQTSGLEWMNECKTNINHYDAEKWAQEQKVRLPTREEFIEAEKHGIRELPGMTWKGYWFWSSTQYAGNEGRYKYVFSGSSGHADGGGHRDGSASNVAARCVSIAGVNKK